MRIFDYLAEKRIVKKISCDRMHQIWITAIGELWWLIKKAFRLRKVFCYNTYAAILFSEHYFDRRDKPQDTDTDYGQKAQRDCHSERQGRFLAG